MTNQEIFEIAVRGIIAQGGPSTNKNRCVYRTAGDNPRKCGAGQLIKDEFYSVDFENISVDPTLGLPIKINAYDKILKLHRKLNQALISSGIAEDQLEFVSRLQSLHDEPARMFLTDTEFSANFRQMAKGFAIAYGLYSPF